MGPQGLQDIKPRYFRHHEIEQEKIRAGFLDRAHGFSGVVDQHKLGITGLLQKGLNDLHRDGFIIDHHDLGIQEMRDIVRNLREGVPAI